MKVLFSSDISLNWLAEPKTDEGAARLYEEVLPYFGKADFSMVNMENIFGRPEEETPIVKIGPNLIAGPEMVNLIDALHPTVVNFANNHTGDYGTETARRNFADFRKKGYLLTGCGETVDEAYQPVYLEKDGVKIGIVGVCENEFGTATDASCGSAGYDFGHLSRTILEIRENGARPVVYFHGGNEFNPFPSPFKVDLYRHLIDFGCAAVIAMHTHCPQGYELYHGGAIVYSMGNFYFPRDLATYPAVAKESWFWGYMTELDITSDQVEMNVIPYHFDSDRMEVLKGDRAEFFGKYMEKLNAPLSDLRMIRKLFDSWSYYRGLDFIGRAYYTEDKRHGDRESLRQLKSVFNVEAHYELVRNTVNLLFYGEFENAGEYCDLILKLQEMRLD